MHTNIDFIKGNSIKKYIYNKEQYSRFINLHSAELKFIVPWAQYGDCNSNPESDKKSKPEPKRDLLK